MIEPLLERIGELEKSNRRWKTTSLILGTILLAMMTTGTLFFGIYGYHLQRDRQAMQAREEALMQAQRARAVAEEAARAQQKANKE